MTYKLSFTGEEIDEKLGKINEFENSINSIEENISNIEDSINNTDANINNIENSINVLEEDIYDIKQQSKESFTTIFTSSESESWKVTKSSNFTEKDEKGKIKPKEFINCFNLLAYSFDKDKPSGSINGLGNTWRFAQLKTPYPLKNAVVTINPRYYQGIALNAKIINNCLVDYSVCYLGDTPNPTDGKVTHGISIQGERATPPDAPRLGVGNADKRAEAIAVAQSYINARNSGRVFSYGENFIGYANSTVLNDKNGAARLECDAFVFLVMSGIPYKDSPYTNTTKGATYNFDNLTVNPNGYTWCLPWKEREDLDLKIYKRKITTTGWQNFFCWKNQIVFKNYANAEAGDIVMFTLPPEKEGLSKYNFFDRVTHVGIVGKEPIGNGKEELYIYHVGDSENGTRSTLNYEPLQAAIDRRCSWNEVYFARPNYTEDKGVWE